MKGLELISKLLPHANHEIVLVVYGEDSDRGRLAENIAVECEDCNEIIWDEDLVYLNDD